MNLKQRMQNGKCAFGTWSMLSNASVVDVIACSGIDFVVIDMEHGSIGWETAESMTRAAQARGCQPIIRVGDSQENTILHALETGCKAIMVPNVNTVDIAKKVSRSCRYMPEGMRGLSPYTSCHDYTHSQLDQSLQVNNEETLVGILVEGVSGLNRLDEISSVDGIDLIYLGLYDISQSAGFPGELDHPEVRDRLSSCLTTIRNSGKLAGTFCRSISDAIECRDNGFQFVAYVADSYGLRTFFEEAYNSFKDSKGC